MTPDEFRRHGHQLVEWVADYMEGVAIGDLPFDYAAEREVFEKTFAVLAATLAQEAFTGYDVRGARPAQFLSLHYEACTLGLVPHLEQISLTDFAQVARIRDALDSVKRDERFRQMTTGGGKNFRRQLEQRIRFVAETTGAAL